MLYKDLAPGSVFLFGKHYGARTSLTIGGELCTIDGDMAWYKMDDGRSILLTDCLTCNFDNPRADGSNDRERRHGRPVYPGSVMQKELEQRFLGLFTLEESSKLCWMETRCPTPSGYTKKLGPELKWTAFVTLPTKSEIVTENRDSFEEPKHDAVEAKNLLRGYNRYSDWTLCEGEGIYCYALHGLSGYFSIEKQRINYRQSPHPIVKLSPNTNLEQSDYDGVYVVEEKLPDLEGNLVDILKGAVNVVSSFEGQAV